MQEGNYKTDMKEKMAEVLTISALSATMTRLDHASKALKMTFYS